MPLPRRFAQARPGMALSAEFLNLHSRAIRQNARQLDALYDIVNGLEELEDGAEDGLPPIMTLTEQSRQVAIYQITDSNGDTHQSEPVTQVVFTDQTGRMWTLDWTPPP